MLVISLCEFHSSDVRGLSIIDQWFKEPLWKARQHLQNQPAQPQSALPF
jgi:hypothetical protein